MVWTAPEPSELGDHDVIQLGDYLQGKSIALCITGSVAAMKTPLLARALRRYGAEVTVFIDKSGLRFVAADALRWATNHEIVTELTYRSEHLNGGHPFDAYLVAPASYNTVNKMANGSADSLITTVMSSAIGNMQRGDTRILVAPAMHGSMHNSIFRESLRKLQSLGVRLIKPRQEFGKNNLPSQERLVMEVCRVVNKKDYPKSVLVTAGAVGVKVDSIRRLTNKFSGKLGILIAKELHLRGHDVLLLQSNSGIRPPKWLPHKLYDDFDEYLKLCIEYSGIVGPTQHQYGIYSAAVADYQPAKVAEGKISSGETSLTLDLVPTAKVIEEIHKAHPRHKIISFKYEHAATLARLVDIAKERLKTHKGIVVNSGETRGPNGEQLAYLFSNGCDSRFWPKNPSLAPNESPALIGKKKIAKILVDELEKHRGAFSDCE